MPTALTDTAGCDLLENTYLCKVTNTDAAPDYVQQPVVIC